MSAENNMYSNGPRAEPCGRPKGMTTQLLSSLWVSRAGSASDWCALQEALYKCIDRPTATSSRVFSTKPSYITSNALLRFVRRLSI